jgi:hypothetical protein
MKTRRVLRGILFGTGLLVAVALPAQFVSLARCQAAIPCSIPFAVQYRPDPFLAGQYGRVQDSAVSVRVPLKTPILPELDKGPEQNREAVDAAVRKSLEMLPPPGARKTKPPAEKTDTP